MEIAQPTIACASGQDGPEWRGSIRLTILGQPVAMKNNYRAIPNRKHPGVFMIIPGTPVKKYMQSIRRQVPVREPLLTGKLRFTATLYYGWEGPDLDAEAIYDALQDVIYKNDRQLRRKYLDHAIDKLNPRAEILIEPLQAELV